MQGTLASLNVYNLSAEIADSTNYPMVRSFTVSSKSSFIAVETITPVNPSSGWALPGPATTQNSSATGYFTARELYKLTGVPIGFIASAWGGSQIESWLDPAFASSDADLTQPYFDRISTIVPVRDTVIGLYNGMIAPLVPAAIKGVVWYQGEANASRPEQYSRFLPALIAKHRSQFGQPKLPFLVVQLPDLNGYASLRDSQLQTVKDDPHSRLITTIDIGEEQVHPRDKQDVGLRAARAAAELAYGMNVVGQGPTFNTATVQGSSIRCSFTHPGGGLMIGSKQVNQSGPQTPVQQVSSGTLNGFTIAGSNRVYYAATAVIDPASNTVVVSSPNVSNPVYVRYAWFYTNPQANLYSKVLDGSGTVVDGMPASPFSNDPSYKLAVNYGTGTGNYDLNANVPITASVQNGLTFLNWSGDTNQLGNPLIEATTATVSKRYTSVLANYQVTGTTSLVALATKPGQVMLTWAAIPTAHYRIKRATALAGPYSTLASEIAGTQYVDNTATAGTTYYYKLTPFNTHGDGPDSLPVAASGISAGDTSAQVALSWNTDAGPADSYTVERATTAGGPYATLSSGSTNKSFVDRNLAVGATYYYLITAVHSGIGTPVSDEFAVTPSFLPAPSLYADVGTVGSFGGAFANGAGTYTVKGSGAGIQSVEDSCSFAYSTTPLIGDFTLTVHVSSLGTNGTYPEAGVMVRSSLSADSVYASASTRGDAFFFRGRQTAGNDISLNVGNPYAVSWVRIARTGTTCRASRSVDGANWVQLGAVTTISGPVYPGMFSFSGDVTVTNTSTFDNFSIGPSLTLQAPSAPTSLDGQIAIGGFSIGLTWHPVSTASSYKVKRSIAPGGTYSTLVSGLKSPFYTDPTVTAGNAYYYVVTAVNEAGESTPSVEFAAGTPGDWWRLSRFGSNADIVAIAGDFADPDHDGIVNLMERALNGDPQTPSQNLYAPSTSGNRLAIDFERSPANTDLTIAVQGRDDLVSGAWQDLATSVNGAAFNPVLSGVVVNESGTGTVRSVEVRDAYNINDPSHPRRFLRIRVISASPWP